ncbi:hypothetical protein VCRA2122O12_50081 [Vibrio crassostreae]|nr:hypothetical protein VCRA2114E5_50157 [Vibrio crassostreae]CAK2103855.1 hypothetical protein VCRA2110O1_50081 [Vibrio crassostreae]CAK2107736.1 hypothetical protein VCRA2110O4_50155 [Vibrio crassostreae]CAK2890982.1 hypothetical protein VCRA2110O3_50153 [Vibrio crassostreae]CAK2973085.1 hypothetical protein VCRA2122O10_50081 [Vibrio crassostreae]
MMMAAFHTAMHPLAKSNIANFIHEKYECTHKKRYIEQSPVWDTCFSLCITGNGIIIG